MSIEIINNVCYIENENDFQEIVKKSKDENVNIIVKFSASWCGPFKKIKSLYEKYASMYTKSIFLYVDTDKVPEISSYYKISSLPTFSIIRKGEYKEILRGANPQQLTNILYLIHNE